MKITTHGFIVLLPQSKTKIDDVCQHIASLSTNAHGKYFIVMTNCVRQPDFWIGVILKPKNMKAFCKMRGTEKHYEVEPEELGDQEKILDFNHFIIHKKSGRGFYQTYHNSIRIETLLTAFKYAHANVEHNANFDLNPERKHDFSPYKQNFLKYQIYVRTEDLPAFLNELDKLREVEIGYTAEALGDVSKHEGIKGDIRDETVIIKFHPKQIDRQTVLQSVLRAAEKNGYIHKKFVVRGMDPQKNHRTFNVLNAKDYSKFDELDYHEFVKNLRYDSYDLATQMQDSVAIDALIRVALSDDGKDFLSKRLTLRN